VPNSQHLISSRSYFPPVTAQPGRRLHIARSFRAKGNFDEVVAEEIRRLDGTMAKQTNLLDDGRKHIVDYADDGITFVGEKWFAKPDCCMDPVLQSDMRWFADAKHTVAHANVLNGDGTHTITDFDISEHVLRLEQQPQYGSVPGTTIEAYYLGSYKLRYRAKCDYSSDHVEYLREDGTLSYTLSMSYGLVTIKYFDNTGKKQVLEQTWYRNTDTTDGVTKHTYVLSDVTLTDAEGNKTRMLTVNHEGRAYHEELYDATINGVKYKEVDNFYSPDGTLSESRFWNTSVDHPYDKSEPHTAAENLRVTVPVGVLAMRVQIDEDLPVPYPQRGEGGM
jgi:hypothetical protein